jgi:threonylcarbamoyladenosine tRNA methylthiotransferase MtaB
MKIYFYTLGCKVNQYETQVIREHYLSLGHTAVEDHRSADMAIINSCTVTHNADADCRQIVRRILRESPNIKKVIVTGCYVKVDPDKLRSISDKIQLIDKTDLLSECANGETGAASRLGTRTGGMITSFHDHTRAFVKIQDGCNAFCSYCIVPYVRPVMWSKPKHEIITEITGLIDHGHKGIVLCGIRLGIWSDGKDRLSDLLKQIAMIDKPFTIELSSIEMTELDDDLIEVIRTTDKIKKHLHVPVQSGDDETLKQMNRPYTIKKYINKIKYIRSRIPGISITTDVMVGFPGETESRFKNTYESMKTLNFDKLHVFRYSARPGTKAAGFKYDISSKDLKNRSNTLLSLSNG